MESNTESSNHASLHLKHEHILRRSWFFVLQPIYLTHLANHTEFKLLAFNSSKQLSRRLKTHSGRTLKDIFLIARHNKKYKKNINWSLLVLLLYNFVPIFLSILLPKVLINTQPTVFFDQKRLKKYQTDY